MNNALRDAISARVKDAYYAARTLGCGDLYTAADDAAVAIMPLIDAYAQGRITRERRERDRLANAVKTLSDRWEEEGFLDADRARDMARILDGEIDL